MSLIYYILDCETTGLSVDFHEMNQLSVMRVHDQKQLSLQIKVKKPNVYNQAALDVQGITPDDLRQGITIKEVISQVDSFFKEDGKTQAHRCIIAHNAPFDRKFVHRAWENEGAEFLADLWICTESFGKRYVKKHGSEKIAQAQLKAGVDLKRDKFGQLKPRFGLNNLLLGVGLNPKAGAHRAEIDVQNTLELYNWLMSSRTEHVSLITRSPQKGSQSENLDVDDF